MIRDAGRPETIEALRRRIDAIDDRLLALLAERLAVAEAIGRVKATEGRGGSDPAREAAIIDRLSADGAVPPDVVALIWPALFTVSLWVQRRAE